MKLYINGEENQVPRAFLEKLMGQLLDLGLVEYDKLTRPARVMIKPLTRGILAWLEKVAAEKHGKEAGKLFRPPSGEDPTPFLARCLSVMLLEGLDAYVDLAIDTSDHRATALSCSIAPALRGQGAGEAGRQVDSARDIGLRQDDRADIS